MPNENISAAAIATCDAAVPSVQSSSCIICDLSDAFVKPPLKTMLHTTRMNDGPFVAKGLMPFGSSLRIASILYVLHKTIACAFVFELFSPIFMTTACSASEMENVTRCMGVLRSTGLVIGFGCATGIGDDSTGCGATGLARASAARFLAAW